MKLSKIWRSIVQPLRLKYKIIAIAVVMAIGLAGYLVFVTVVSNELVQRVSTLESKFFPIFDKANRAYSLVRQYHDAVESALISGEERFSQDADQFVQAYEDILQDLQEIALLNPGMGEELRAFSQVLTTYKEIMIRNGGGLPASQDSLSGVAHIDNIRRTHQQLSKLPAPVFQAAEQIKLQARQQFSTQAQQILASHSDTLVLGALIIVLSILVLCAGIYSMASAITKDIRGVSNALKDIAIGQGDLTKRLKCSKKGEIVELVQWFNLFVATIQSLVKQLCYYTEHMGERISKMKLVIDKTSEGAMRQQQRTINVVSAVEYMLKGVENIAGYTATAVEVAESAEREAEDGGRVVNLTMEDIETLACQVDQTAEVIRALAKDTQSIESLVGDICDIASQTNLLALNAAIEAARAGEQGRGFAVVADEVRSLANRTEKCTISIKETIEGLQHRSDAASKVMEQGRERVRNSVATAARAGASLAEIIKAVQDINKMNVEIAKSTNEQRKLSLDIEQTITEVSSITIKTAGESSETANASQELADISAELFQLIRQFKV